MDGLRELGCTPRWQALLAPHLDAGLKAARVVRSDRGSSLIITSGGIIRAKPSSRLLKAAKGPADLPAVGDWVAVFAPADIDVPLIEVVLERTSAIQRGDPGKTSDVQVLAANIDVVFVVHPIAQPPNLRRIERELALAWDSGAAPVVVLTKADLSANPEGDRAEVASIAFGSDVHVVNALTGEGLEALLDSVSGHRTAVLIGPSGAGKSTLINAFLGERRQATREVRIGDGRGRHTTVARELMQMPGGGMLIDTPGLRELGLTGSEEGLVAAFPDIDRSGHACRFRDCTHTDEPGCAVRAAIESGEIPPERLDSYRKLEREARAAARKTDARLRSEEKRKWKIIHKSARDFYKITGKF